VTLLRDVVPVEPPVPAEPSVPAASPAPRLRRFLLVGAACGVAWAAALRGWMIQLAGTDTAFTWLRTFGLLLSPGLVAGALLGWADFRRRVSGSRRRWLIWSPALFVVALISPRTSRP
jgi:hypothetical protein